MSQLLTKDEQEALGRLLDQIQTLIEVFHTKEYSRLDPFWSKDYVGASLSGETWKYDPVLITNYANKAEHYFEPAEFICTTQKDGVIKIEYVVLNAEHHVEKRISLWKREDGLFREYKHFIMDVWVDSAMRDDLSQDEQRALQRQIDLQNSISLAKQYGDRNILDEFFTDDFYGMDKFGNPFFYDPELILYLASDPMDVRRMSMMKATSMEDFIIIDFTLSDSRNFAYEVRTSFWREVDGVFKQFSHRISAIAPIQNQDRTLTKEEQAALDKQIEVENMIHITNNQYDYELFQDKLKKYLSKDFVLIDEFLGEKYGRDNLPSSSETGVKEFSHYPTNYRVTTILDNLYRVDFTMVNKFGKPIQFRSTYWSVVDGEYLQLKHIVRKL